MKKFYLFFICIFLLANTGHASEISGTQSTENEITKKSIFEKSKDKLKNIKEKFTAKFLKDDDESLEEYNKLFEKPATNEQEKPKTEKIIFSYLAKLNEYSVIMVSLLGTDIPDKVLNIMEHLPLIGHAASISKKLFTNQILWLNKIMNKKGHEYAMINLIDDFKNRGLTCDMLIDKINNIDDSILNKDIKNDSINLLKEYYI